MIVMSKPQNSAVSETGEGKTLSNPGNGMGDAGKTPDTAVARGDQCATPMPDNPDTVARGDSIAARVEHHADAILRAAGSGLRHYSMDGTRRAILSAVMDCYEEAYRAGEVGK